MTVELLGTEDMEKVRQIYLDPVLGDLVVADPVEQNAGQGCRPAARRDAHELGCLACGQRPAARNRVPLSNLVGQLYVDVLECAP
jgi:hypothetical protein